MSKEKLRKTEKFLANQVAVITGSGYGVGQGIAVEFAREGANIVINDLDSERSNNARKLVEKLGVKALCINGDITETAVQQALTQQTIKEFGGIDILVNNVGVGSRTRDLLKTPPEEWERVWKTNFFAGVNLTRTVAQHMIETGRQGKIIFITSVHQERIARDAPYSTTKAALAMLVEELSTELGPKNIRVNGIAPGWIDTRSEATSKHQPGSYVGRASLGRAGLPEEIGQIAVVLASDYWSSYVTGAVIPVDGGLHTFSHRTLEFPPEKT